jgi:hypothetical protein
LRRENYVTQRRQAGCNLGERQSAIVVFSTITIAGNCNENLRFDLREPLQDAAAGKFRRTIGPDRSDASRSKKCDHCLDAVRKVAGNAISL